MKKRVGCILAPEDEVRPIYPATSIKPRGRLIAAFPGRLLILFLILVGTGPRLRAGEITTYVDATGRCVYVNSEDRELSNAVNRGGVTAGLRLIANRKRALPAIDGYIEQVALENQLDPKLVQAVIEIESAWNPKARSSKGALGLMQLMPETAARFGVHDPFDPIENIYGGARYLHFLLNRFDQNLIYTLAAYNAGENVVEWGNLPPYPETRAYVERVATLYAKLKDGSSQSSKVVYRTTHEGRTVYTNIH